MCLLYLKADFLGSIAGNRPPLLNWQAIYLTDKECVVKSTEAIFLSRIADELEIPVPSVTAVIALLAEGNTIPFIARYRKERTNSLDEVQIRLIKERWTYLNELEERRQAILESITSQGKLTPELEASIRACESKTVLEDLYLPYKPKRRTRATIAREKGLEPLAELILSQSLETTPEQAAQAYLTDEVADIESALSGARDIVAETVAENAEIRAAVRQRFSDEGVVVSRVAKEWEGKPSKFEQYYEFSERVATIPSHRYLAIRRGEQEEVLYFDIEIEPEACLLDIEKLMELNTQSPFAEQLRLAIADGYKRLLAPSIETDIRVDLKLKSDEAAVEIFADNLRSLLLASPLGGKSVVGIDPGFRTGCKCVAIDGTGKYLDSLTIYPTNGARALADAKEGLSAFIQRHNPAAVAVGNGTAGRETEAFVRELLKDRGIKDLIVVSVNEAGASVYSASDTAREEFPDLDLTIRGAISIARRLQDPLAELVKIEPKAIGVGQYQHDVHQPLLRDKLHDVVESCVNHVGVELNTASRSLLSYVAGLGPSVAQKIVDYRDQMGRFTSRDHLLDVPGLGPRTFEQAAGFLRLHDGQHPLDRSAVHPERYTLVEQIAKDVGISLSELVGNSKARSLIDINNYTDETVGTVTLNDIIGELEKPGRDPRSSFEAPCFRDDVTKIEDLIPGMTLDGIVTNVTAFGAFVDVGVHQDGLVHIAQLSDKFVKNPRDVVSPGDRIKVKVLEVEPERKRISLTARLSEPVTPRGGSKPSGKAGGKRPPRKKESFASNPFAGL